MGNLIGDPFPLYVKSQIEARQYMLGLKDRPIEVTRYLTNRMPWVRMVSTTNIGKTDNPNSVGYKLKSILGDTALFDGGILRNRLILQNFPKYVPPYAGAFDREYNPGRYKDIGFNKGIQGEGFEDEIFLAWSEGAYGFGGAEERGYVPPPGLTKVSVQYQNNGALAKIDVAMKAFSRTQFALIDALFLRPGFQALVEFGWSIYYRQPNENESPNTVLQNSETVPADSPFGNTISINGFHEFGAEQDTEAKNLIGNVFATPYSVREAIKRDRRRYAGNYDGHLGKITNFKWNLESDGSYSIQVQLTAMGDLVESMKLNVGAGNSELAKEVSAASTAASTAAATAAEVTEATETIVEPRGPENQNLLVEANRFKSSFNQFLFDLDGLSSVLYASGDDAASSKYPDLFANESAKEKKVGANVVAILFPLTFRNFPRPYKSSNLILGLDVNGNEVIKSNTIVPDRSTKTDFVDRNGALRLALQANNTDRIGQLNNLFISFSSICAYVQNNLILYDFSNDSKTPLFYIDDSIYNISADLQADVNPNQYVGGAGEEINYKEYHKDSSNKRWKDKTYMFTFPGHFSARPDICVIPITNLPEIVQSDISNIADGKNNRFLGNTAFSCTEQLSKPAQYLGDLGAVYFNTSYLSNLVADLPSNGSVSVLEFFQTIISDMTNALGNVNEISVVVNDDGDIGFFENRPQRFDDGTGTANAEDYTILNIFGVRPGDDIGDPLKGSFSVEEEFEQVIAARDGNPYIPPQGSIVRDLGLSTSIPQSLTSMIAISAQANPNQPSADATAFAEYSLGLTDSILTQRANNVPEQNTKFEGEFYALVTGSNFTITEEELKRSVRVSDFVKENKAFFAIGRKFYDDTGVLGPTELDTLQEFNTQYSNFIQGELSKVGQIRSNFFLPFNLNLTLDGISGIKNFSKFVIETKALPLSYSPNDNGEGGVEITVNGVSHTIDQNGWVTELDTKSTALRDLQPISPPAAVTAPPPPPAPGGSSSPTRIGGNLSGGYRTPIYYFSGNPSIGEDTVPDGFTSPSGYSTYKSDGQRMYFKSSHPKTCIILHHTAGHNTTNPGTLGWASKPSGHHVSTHFVIDYEGLAERYYNDEYWSYHVGGMTVKTGVNAGYSYPKNRTEPASLSVELAAYGYLYYVPALDKYISDLGTGLPILMPDNEVSFPVDYAGNQVAEYRGYEAFSYYSPAQLDALGTVMEKWMSKYDIPAPKDMGGFKSFFENEMFPPKSVKSPMLFSSQKGIYSHCSAGIKSDVAPTREMWEFLKNL
jgi:hypothetical protein